jgi:hypothetical protein
MFNIFRAIAHLKEQLGDERFRALISSDNTGEVKEFCDQLLKDALPTKMTIGRRTYEILGFLKGDETSVIDHVMINRAEEMNANLGKEDGSHIMAHRNDIPVSLRGKVVFVFPAWHHPDYPENASYICWDDDEWVQDWCWLAYGSWGGSGRVLRRK